MEKLNLLSRAEMKNVVGGVISVQTMYEQCLQGYNVPEQIITTEELILWGICHNQAQNACSFGESRGAICDYEGWTGTYN